MKTRIIGAALFLLAALCPFITLWAQKDLSDKKWKDVVRYMPTEWYGSEEAAKIADQLIARQMDNGGWQKNIPYHHLLSKKELKRVQRTGVGATIDNNSTTMEMTFLAKVYAQRKEKRYKKAFEHGLEYLFDAQYPNGGWPQFFPARPKVPYASHITYNDDAMVNVMKVLDDIVRDRKPYNALALDEAYKKRAAEAFNKGIDCILRTQIVVDGKPTVWCAQHDEHTLAAAPARAFELTSFSGGESVGIVRLLMSLPNPSDKVVKAVDGAVEWFRTHEVKDVKVEHFKGANGEPDARIVPAPGNVMWARFYDLDTGKPFFCDRDGVKRTDLAQVGQERRGGYSWYVTSPQGVLDAYPKWKQRVAAAH